MESTTTRLADEEVRQLILDNKLCPFPRPTYQPHDYNAEAVQEVLSLSPEQRAQWLAERRKERAALRAAIAEG
jgi:hypothetical protein